MQNALEARIVSELVRCAHELRARSIETAREKFVQIATEKVHQIFSGSPRRVFFVNVNNSLTRPNLWIGEVRTPTDAQEMARQTLDGMTFRVQYCMMERFTPDQFEAQFGRMLRDTRKRELIEEAQVSRPRKGFKGHVSWKDQVREHVYGILR